MLYKRCILGLDLDEPYIERWSHRPPMIGVAAGVRLVKSAAPKPLDECPTPAGSSTVAILLLFATSAADIVCIPAPTPPVIGTDTAASVAVSLSPAEVAAAVAVAVVVVDEVSIICFRARICNPPQVRLIPPAPTIPPYLLPIDPSPPMVVVVGWSLAGRFCALVGFDVEVDAPVAVEALSSAMDDAGVGTDVVDVRDLRGPEVDACAAELPDSGELVWDMLACLRRCCCRMLCSVGFSALNTTAG